MPPRRRLGIAKRWLADKLGRSRGEAKARRTFSARLPPRAVLMGLLVNAVFGLWWLDPAAALAVAATAVTERRANWPGESC